MFGIKSSYRAPEGYSFIGFDYSGEELNVAAIYADKNEGKGSGCSKLGNAILIGDKKKGTDPHSLTAKAASVGRNTGKGGNFA